MFLLNADNFNQFINTNTANTIPTNPAFPNINTVAGTGENITDKLDQAWTLVNTEINDFLQFPDWVVKTRLAITGDWLANEAQDFFSHVSPENINVGILPANNMPGIAGGYDAITGKIYLSEDLLKYSDPNKIAEVLVEEIGHKADDILNPGQDSPGDEGEILSNIISHGGNIPTDWQILKQEDDHKSIKIGDSWHKVQAASVIPNISIASITIPEGDVAGQTNAVFTVSLDQTTDQTVTLKYTTADDLAAKSVSDFTAQQGSINFLPGEITKTIVIPVISDKLVETNENFPVNLSEAINGNIIKSQAIATIFNDDLPNISVEDIAIKEGNFGQKNAVFKVKLDQMSRQVVSLKYQTVAGTADITDFQPLTGTIQFPALSAIQTVVVPIIGDSVWETDETFSIQLSEPTNGNITKSQGIGTITNDDFPNISIDDSTIVEGNEGQTNAQFKVKLNQAIGQDVTVKYKAIGKTAVAGINFLPQEQEIKFLAGQTEQIINIPIIGNTIVERDKQFIVQLSQSNIGKIVDYQALGTITNDDLPKVAIGDVSVLEGNEGAKNARFEVNLDQKSHQNITVQYKTTPITADDQDFTTEVKQINFSPNVQKQIINIPIKGDTSWEPDEMFSVELSDAMNATIIKPQGTATILNDDKPSISIEDLTITEGNSGEKNAEFKVTLDQVIDQNVSVKYTTSGLNAAAGLDFVAKTGEINFLPGQKEQIIAIPIIGDTQLEGNEKFSLKLSQPNNAKIFDAQAIGTITNDDQKIVVPNISIKGINIIEGNSGQKNAAFVVDLDNVSDKVVTVKYDTISLTAKAGEDFIAQKNQIEFSPGEKSKMINIPIKSDTVLETDEKFIVQLSSAQNGKITKAEGQGIIISDDYTAISEKEPDNDSMSRKIPTFTNLIPQDISVSGNIGYNVGGNKRDTNDYYGLVLDKSNREYNVVITLDGLSDDAQLAIYSKDGTIFRKSEEKTVNPERIQEILPKGTYYVKVYPNGSAKTSYILSAKRVIA